MADYECVHNDDLEFLRWWPGDTLSSQSPIGSVPVITINQDAVNRREAAWLLERIAASRKHEAKS